MRPITLAVCLGIFALSSEGLINGQGKALAGNGPDVWPDALITRLGQQVNTPAEFLAIRRPEILHDFEENVYGRTPPQAQPPNVTEEMRITSIDSHAFNGLAVRRQINVTVYFGTLSRTLHILLYVPAAHHGPVPVFLGLNFNGNQTVTSDPSVDSNDVWIPDPDLKPLALAKELEGHVRRQATEGTRGADANQWPIAEILRAGYALATLYAGDIEPDFATGIGYGIRPLFFKPGQGLPEADDWGAIGAWAWGMSRAADYLATDPTIDAHAIIAIGHSRFGKAALWAAAQDQRFAMTISNESGQGGASLSHRHAAESVAHLNIAFPYWFCSNYHHFTGRTSELPVDGHLLLALIAPRPLFVASAHDDPYSDPEGEFLSAKAASAVYRLFGKSGLSDDARYEINRPSGKTLRYYVRPGGHDMLLADWQQYIQFANENLPQRAH